MQPNTELSFKEVLDASDISYNEIHIFSNRFSTPILEIIGKVNDGMPWSSIERVLIAWLSHVSNRRVTVTREKPDGQYEKIDATGYSAKQINHMLRDGDEIQLTEDKAKAQARTQRSL
ncbi:hypothetical protein [Glaciimonas sp. PCH181]|uniref:hypothetical protein n=1 Tax=Glaciimonas sp. PCH181 TaxID=2133943 RepID=UPI0011B21054|nr:hypothetical protein [Glaciimonas sp. PCH181]